MTPSSVLIQYDKCRLTLNLPIFFEEANLINIRKVLKMLDERLHQNKNAKETLDQFLPAWERKLKDRLDRAKAELNAAMQDAANKRRIVAAMGSALETNIKQAKMRLDHARKKANRQPGEIDECREALNKAVQPQTDHEKALKEVKRTERAVKTAKAALERSGKIIKDYKAIKE